MLYKVFMLNLILMVCFSEIFLLLLKFFFILNNFILFLLINFWSNMVRINWIINKKNFLFILLNRERYICFNYINDLFGLYVIRKKIFLKNLYFFKIYMYI